MTDITKFERIIIKGFLKGYASRDMISAFSEDYFETIQLRQIFRALKNYFITYSEIPQVDVLVNEISKDKSIKKDEIRNMEAFLEKDEKFPEDKFLYAVQEVNKEFISRKIRKSMKNAITFLDKGELVKAKEVLLKGTSDSMNENKEIKIVDYVKNFNDRKEGLVRRRDNPELYREFCIPTGIRKLDFELDGGLRRGELGLWLAPPEGGKSIALQDTAMAALLVGYKVAFVTIEMTPEQTAYRLDSRLTQLRYRNFRRSKLSDEEVGCWEEKVKTLQENSLKIMGVPEGCSCRLIESELAKLSGTFAADLVVVDYAGIMSPYEGRYDTSMDWRFVGAIVRNLKGLALKLNIPIWSASQLLVGAKEKAEVSFVDVGLARQQIAAHADVCIGILQNAQLRAMDITKLQLVKVREGCESRFLEVQSDFDRIKLERAVDDSSEGVVPF